MADITNDCTIRKGVTGDIMVLSIVTPVTAATGDTIDLASDVADGKGVIMTEILNTVCQNAVGATKPATWVQATGIITLGSITTGIHNLVVFGK